MSRLVYWRRGWPVVIAAHLGMTLLGIFFFTAGVFFAPLEQAFGWTRAEVSLSTTIVAIAGMLLSAPVGMVLDRWGTRRMALFGEVFDADAALRLGIVDHIVESGAGMAAARQIAAQVCGRAPLATELTKMLVNAAEGEESERVLEALAGIAAARSEDLQEGLAAFREKRPARF